MKSPLGQTFLNSFLDESRWDCEGESITRETSYTLQALPRANENEYREANCVMDAHGSGHHAKKSGPYQSTRFCIGTATLHPLDKSALRKVAVEVHPSFLKLQHTLGKKTEHKSFALAWCQSCR